MILREDDCAGSHPCQTVFKVLPAKAVPVHHKFANLQHVINILYNPPLSPLNMPMHTQPGHNPYHSDTVASCKLKVCVLKSSPQYSHCSSSLSCLIR